MMLWGPMIGAVLGTWFQLHEHPEVIRHGLVVSLPSSGAVVAGAVIGVALGVVASFLLAFLWAAWRYRFKGDDTWEAVYCGRDATVMFFELRCKEDVPPADPLHLGEVQCALNKPSRSVVMYRNRPQLLGEPPGLMAFISAPRESGRYEVRWYASREGKKWREVARKRLTLRADEPDSPWKSREAVA
jgi:hypothetical protein